MKRLLPVVLFIVGIASAQTAVVTRNMNLSPDASADQPPFAKFTPGTQLKLI